MTRPERGKLIPVTGTNDDPDMNNAIDVQFNPVTLKVTLSNTLKANERDGSTNAAQFVDKSSSTLSLDLMFDTTRADADAGDEFSEGADVRDQTRRIAETFIQPQPSGNDMKAPKRCLFQWGSFEFIGLVESYDETLEFFSPQGRPLRAKLALRLKEDRFQFRQRTDGVDPANPAIPTLSPTGQAEENPARPAQQDSPVPGPSEGQDNWRDTASFNGIENPRMPGVSVLATPGSSVRSGASASAGFAAATSVQVTASAGIRQQFSSSASTQVQTRMRADRGVGFE